MKRTPRRVLYHLGALLVVVLFVLPLYWMLMASLRQPGQPPPRTIEWLPNPAVWANYAAIFELAPLATALVNSVLVVLVAVPLTILTASGAGFAMARLNGRLQRGTVLLSIVLLMIPAVALWLPRLVLYRYLGLLDTLAALILPALMGSSPFFVLLFYWTFRRISPELFAAATLDGAGNLALWWRIGLPLARPTMLVVGVLSAMLYWGDFVSPLLYIRSESRYTLPVGVVVLRQMDITNWPLLMAAATLLSIPAVVLFLLVQHWFWFAGRFSESADATDVLG
ncbi:MAG: carbohydrate ABC transporter permease [Chloroflexaceae bacterium]|nr:carbohydrate ABC transporter permease [Chloroflexaceae bacterium]NJL35154.1 carbohydrate ABC transporter permease [Chloroflexaceae bacterium]NJO05181.1 carbohydrate ABC transporter permease [Chloroflexaceae bacterium]